MLRNVQLKAIVEIGERTVVEKLVRNALHYVAMKRSLQHLSCRGFKSIGVAHSWNWLFCAKKKKLAYWCLCNLTFKAVFAAFMACWIYGIYVARGNHEKWVKINMENSPQVTTGSRFQWQNRHWFALIREIYIDITDSTCIFRIAEEINLK